MDTEQLAAEKAAAYVEGYRQCLEDVLKDGVELAEKLASSSSLEAIVAESYAASLKCC